MTSRYRISSHSLRVGGDTIDYEVRRSARRKKTVQLSVRDGGAVIVNAPARMKDVDIREFVRARADWIARDGCRAGGARPQTAQIRQRRDTAVPRRPR